MYIAITLKRYRAVKEAGEIKMHVGSVAYYQLMLVCQAEYFRQLLKPVTQSGQVKAWGGWDCLLLVALIQQSLQKLGFVGSLQCIRNQNDFIKH